MQRRHAHRDRRPAVAILFVCGLLMASLVASCAGVTGTPTQGSGTSGSGTTGQVDYPLGQVVVWTGPAGARVSPFLLGPLTDCANGQTQIPSGDTTITLTILAPDCPSTTEPPINGRHGTYLTPPSFAMDLTHPGTVPTGDLAVFTQTYSEYTNTRTDFTDTVGLITLSGVSGYEAIMMVRTGPSGSADPAAIVAAACAISIGHGRSLGSACSGT